MNMKLNNKLIFVCILSFSLFFYCIVYELSAYDIEYIDKSEIKIDKKEVKAKELFTDDNISYCTLQYVVGDNDVVHNSFNFSFIYQRFARPPPCLIPFDSVLKHTFLSTEK